MSNGLKDLFDKYIVTDLNGTSNDNKYFVLDLTNDPHAREALKAYAKSCQKDYPELSKDLYVITEVEQ